VSRLRERMYGAYLQGGAASGHFFSIQDLERRRPTLASLVSRHFPEQRNVEVLDIGCGHGALSYFAREQGYLNVAGIDVSPQQVELARQLGIEGVEEGDLLESLRQRPAASLDVIVAFDVIEHFTKDELLDLVDAAARVLRPGGRWLIQAPNGESPFCGAIRFGDMTHEQAFTRTSLDQLLLASGFGSVRCFETAPVAAGIKGVVRLLAWKFIRVALRVWSIAETGDTGRDAVFTRNLLAVAVRKG
jgi:2-polyprenyl-3-methyl-5-hydroxy-6-metoxy-1,4-benzoquinol methylase